MLPSPMNLAGWLIHRLHRLPCLDADNICQIRRALANPLWWKPDLKSLHDRVTQWAAEGKVMKCR